MLYIFVGEGPYQPFLSHISVLAKRKTHLSCAEAPYQPWVLYTIIYDYHYCDHY